MPDPLNVAVRIRRMLDERGLTVAEVARDASMAKQQLWVILSGKNPNPGILTITRIVEAAGGTMAELFGDD
jgi:transcriptional regulator with XRE-family HTH domain